jgi:hypothetical protein
MFLSSLLTPTNTVLKLSPPNATHLQKSLISSAILLHMLHQCPQLHSVCSVDKTFYLHTTIFVVKTVNNYKKHFNSSMLTCNFRNLKKWDNLNRIKNGLNTITANTQFITVPLFEHLIGCWLYQNLELEQKRIYLRSTDTSQAYA